MNCKKCNKPNRPQARYCKWCGAPVEAARSNAGAAAGKSGGKLSDSVLDELFDKDDIRESLADIVEKAARKADFCRRNGIKERMQLSFLITGESGTGKSATAEIIARLLHKAGIVKTPVPEVISPISFDGWVEEIDDNVARIENTVLVVEDAHKLVPEPDSQEISQLDYILEPMRKWREQSNRPVVIINGNLSLREYFNSNPQAASVINYSFRTNTLTEDGLLNIAVHLLSNKYHRNLTDGAREKLRRIFINDRRNPDDALGANGHNAASRAYNIDLAALNASAQGIIGEELIIGKEFRPRTLPEIMAEFNKYVGAEDIKKEIRNIATTIQEEIKAGRPPLVEHHYRFLGNPGTGKTTMARLFAEALNALGALSVGHLVEVDSIDRIVSSFVGDTPKLVKAVVEEAVGGVLFIDEAYQLMNNSHGVEAVNALMTHLVKHSGKMVCIIAGYNKEMGEFMKTNTGLPSRFDKIINFPDYNAEQLTEIFRRKVNSAKPYVPLSPEAESGIEKFFQRMYLTRTSGFGNARAVGNAYKQAVENMRVRLQKDPTSPYQITMADIEGEDPAKKQTVDEILAELDDMVGMEGVKEQLRKIARKVRNDRRRQERQGADAVVQEVHIAITGNPGTGKTEVAKRLGKILKAMGILPKGHLVQREKKTLLDSMANSAGINMDKAVDEALGGVLFIDEAYNLIPMDNPQDKDKDGVAAVEALMTRMTEDKGKFVTVIAGYKDRIDEFIANANPGLERRFTHRIHIDDYTAEQLTEIYMRAASKNFRLTDEAKALLGKKIQEMVTMKPRNFGNAGTILKLLSETIERHDDRIGDDDVSDDELITIEACDIPYDPPRKVDISQCMKDLDNLTGLRMVKESVHKLADAMIAEQMIAQQEGRRPNIPLHHYLFVGNPGTGKTTVARIMGNIFYSLGLLPSNKVVEVKTSDLIVGLVGQTAPKTRQQFERGLGGVFFIDEAYGLKESSFGQDATNELLTLLLDNEGKVVCIAAGYPREIQEWLDTNSGTRGRFKEVITFEDYTADELAQIFISRMKNEGKSLDPGAEMELHAYLEERVRNKGADFGNAREAVTYFEKVKINQAARLRREMEQSGFDRSELYILRREDMMIL